MAKSLKDMMEAANAAVPRLPMEEVQRMIRDEDALVVDVRDGPEVEKTGRVAGATHVSRGMLEFRADAASPYHDPAFRKDRPIIVYCASGGRSALAGHVLREMGFAKVFNLGAFKDWAESGGAVEHPLDPGM